MWVIIGYLEMLSEVKKWWIYSNWKHQLLKVISPSVFRILTYFLQSDPLMFLKYFQNHGVQGLETLIRDIGDYTPFKGRVGVPSLETLVLQHVPGIQGHLLCDSLSYFKNLTDVQLKNCACLKE